MSEKDMVDLFECPACGAPHFGSHQKPGEERTYVCHGNEWAKSGSGLPCGWQGSGRECFREVTREEAMEFHERAGIEAFFARNKKC